jgi:carboxyl-terminal processing protease
MKRFFFFFISILVLSACARKTSNQKDVPTFKAFLSQDLVGLRTTSGCDADCAQRRQEFRYVVYVGKEVYCYWTEKKAETGTDFDKLASELESEIVSGMTETQYIKILRLWASAFHDGHVNAIPSDATALEIYTSPLRVEVLAPGTDHEKVVVTKGTSVISAGDVVVEINGKPILQALDEAEAISSGSTKRMRRNSAARRLVDVWGSDEGTRDLIITVTTQAGKTVTEAIARKVEINAKPDPDAPATAAPTGADLISAQILPHGVGYLRIDGFSGSQDSLLLAAAMDRLSKTQRLILDLRKNGGGDLSGNVILARLAGSNIVRYQRSERSSPFIISQRPEVFLLPTQPGSLFVDWHNLDVGQDGINIQYKNPVVALISSSCFSACDTFSAALKDYGLAKFVGEPTGGGTGTPLVFWLPNSGHNFRYSVIRGLTPKGAAIEGQGTFPDVSVEPLAEDRASSKDRQLEMALKVLGVSESASEVAAAMAIKSAGAIWEQDSKVSPSTIQENWLKRISSKDEL